MCACNSSLLAGREAGLLPASHRAVGKQSCREAEGEPHDTLRGIAELELDRGAPSSKLSLLGLFSL